MLNLAKISQIKHEKVKLESLISARLKEETKVIDKVTDDKSKTETNDTNKNQSNTNNTNNINDIKCDLYFNDYNVAIKTSLEYTKVGKKNKIVNLSSGHYGIIFIK